MTTSTTPPRRRPSPYPRREQAPVEQHDPWQPANDAPASPAGDAGVASDRAARSVQLRERRRQVASMPLAGHAAPWPVTALLWAAAAAAHAGGDKGLHIVAVAAPVLAVVWWWRYSRRCSRAMRRMHRRHALLVSVAAYLWLLWAAAGGAGGWHAAALWAGMYALLQPYWRRRAIPIPPPRQPVAAPVVAPEPEPEPEPLPEVVKWTTRVTVPGGAAPGSYLTGLEQVRNGRAYTIQLTAGRQTTSQIIAAQAMICSALDLTADGMLIDRHPSGLLSRARLVVIEGNPLNVELTHPGPDKVYNPETGYAAVGLHPDEEQALWGFYIPGYGLAHGFIIGATGSGKSTLMKNLGTTAAHTGYLSVWAGCPLGGQSFPALLRHAVWPARGVPSIMRQLRAMDKVIKVRGKLNDILDRELHIPTRQEPGVLLILDELHKVTRGHVDFKEAVYLLATIAREGRKAAVGIIGADQTVNLMEAFGNSDVMRTNMWNKNLAALRVPSTTEVGMIEGLDANPADLPEFFPDGSPTFGLGYLRGLRTAPFRGWWTPNADELLAASPQTELDGVAAAAIGEDYTRRHQLRDQARVEQARELYELDPAVMTAIAEVNPDLAEQLRADLARPRPARPARAVGETSRVTSSGTLLVLAGEFEPAPTLRLPDPARADTRTSEQRVYDLIASGVTRTGDLQKAYGCGETRMRQLTGALVEAGRIRTAGHGQWQLTEPAGQPRPGDAEHVA